MHSHGTNKSETQSQKRKKDKENEKEKEVITGDEAAEKKKKKEMPIWKKRSIFWDLPYWKELDVRHCIDVMHVEKNFCDSITGTLLNTKFQTKYSANARLEARLIRAEKKRILPKSLKRI